MFDDVLDHIIIYDPFLQLAAVHQTLLAYAVDLTWYTGGAFVYLINSSVGEDLTITACVSEMRILYMPVSLNTLHGEFEQPCR